LPKAQRVTSVMRCWRFQLPPDAVIDTSRDNQRRTASLR
jgi:hypothetical protein